MLRSIQHIIRAISLRFLLVAGIIGIAIALVAGGTAQAATHSHSSPGRAAASSIHAGNPHPGSQPTPVPEMTVVPVTGGGGTALTPAPGTSLPQTGGGGGSPTNPVLPLGVLALALVAIGLTVRAGRRR